MTTKDDNCPKCGAEMETGFLLDTTNLLGKGVGTPLRWVEIDQLARSTKTREGDPGQREVDAYRCINCGYLELYAGLGDPEG